jgi:hypothetical protein
MHGDGDEETPRGLLFAARAVTIVCVGMAAFAALALSPRVFYADPWRYAAVHAQAPFWTAALTSDNGHREVLPNIVRVAELAWCDGAPWLQIGVGLAVFAAAGWVAWRALAGLPVAARAAAGLALAAGTCWGGNFRKLAHGNELLHMAPVLLALAVGLRAIQGRGTTPPTPRIGAFAALCTLVATFSFSSGLACAPAFAVAMWLRRAPWRAMLPLGAGAGLAVAGLLIGRDDPLPVGSAGPVAVVDQMLRWLGAPSAWMFSPLLDPAHAARLPGTPLQALAGAVAGPLHAAFGPPLLARWPALLFGAVGLAWLLRATWRARRADPGPAARFGLALSWCGLAVGALVVAARRDYFVEWPIQLTTQRYLPWSMLVWTGLVVHATATAPSGRGALLRALAFALTLLPSDVWTTRYAYRQRVVAELTAAGAVVGVLDAKFEREETMLPDLLAAIPPLRAQRKGPFAWREAQQLGGPIADASAYPPEPTVDLQIADVDNALGDRGRSVRFTGPTAHDRLLLVEDGVVRGLAVRAPFGDGWRGWMTGVTANPPRAVLAVALRPE